MKWLSACLLAASLSSVLAVDIKGSLEYNFFLKNATELRPGVKVVLNHGERSAFIRQNGSFSIPDVPEGEYALEVISNTHAFEPLYLTVSDDESVYVQPYQPLGTPLTRPSESSPSSSPTSSSSPGPGSGSPPQPPSYASLPYPIILHPKLRLSDVFYDASPSAGSNLLGMLKSPMVLMLMFTGIMAFAMPKILENLEVDPEDAKSVKEMRERFQSVQTTDWGERLAGKLAGVSESPSVVAPAAGAPATGGAAKRRKGR